MQSWARQFEQEGALDLGSEAMSATHNGPFPACCIDYSVLLLECKLHKRHRLSDDFFFKEYILHSGPVDSKKYILDTDLKDVAS